MDDGCRRAAWLQNDAVLALAGEAGRRGGPRGGDWKVKTGEEEEGDRGENDGEDIGEVKAVR